MQPPDSGFNMDTVADFQLPDFLDPGAATLRPAPTPMAMQPIPPHGPPVIVELEPEPDPPAEEGAIDPRQYILAAVVGIGVAVVLGGVAFLAWRFIAPPPVVPSDAPPPGHSQAEPAPRPAPPARSAASTTGAPSSISFRVSPASATLFVDGKPLASSTSPARTMPRLAHGRTATVVARAEGFDDETMQLDDSVSGSVDVVLTRHDTKPAVAANEP